MRLSPFACLAGVEIANDARSAAYIANVGMSSGSSVLMPSACACSAYDEGNYTTPDADPAPWLELTRDESSDFFGFHMHSANLDTVFTREVTQTGRQGGVLAPLRAKTRQVLVSGNLLARSAAGMAYGERWLTEALRGAPCDGDGCPSSDLVILPACPDEDADGYETDGAFRTLVNVGVVDGPVFGQINNDLPECFVQQGSFVLSSSMPWLYHPATRCLDAQAIVGTLSCSLETPEWMGSGTFRFELENTGVTAATDIVIEGRISLDGSCPVTGAGLSVPPTFTYTVPTLAAENKLVIDGLRRQAHHYDASDKFWLSALPYIDFDGPFVWPDAGNCTVMCVTITAGSGTVTATVDTALREF